MNRVGMLAVWGAVAGAAILTEKVRAATFPEPGWQCRRSAGSDPQFYVHVWSERTPSRARNQMRVLARNAPDADVFHEIVRVDHAEPLRMGSYLIYQGVSEDSEVELSIEQVEDQDQALPAFLRIQSQQAATAEIDARAHLLCSRTRN